jgi:diazepam-binding inhibitor (GABA receptor modulator, acyl-CoA-binding protein)
MSLLERFTTAVANSKTLSEKPDNETLLQLYSLYKQATEAKFKHEAWEKLKGMTKETAMEQYAELVEKLKG